VTVTNGLKIKLKNTNSAIEIRIRKSSTKRLNLFGLETDSSKEKLSVIISVQVQRQNAGYYATIILKTKQDGTKCEAIEQVKTEHQPRLGNSTPKPAYVTLWSVHN
jgi:hypothetical protein